ncbi:MAG: dioxygenase [Pirellulales bacterium]|nr:dioxygenase [Pirellulales bacterium]
MIRKESSHGIGYSVVELGEVSHVFAAAVPQQSGSLEEQTLDALQTIAKVIDDKGPAGTIVKQAVFIDDAEKIPVCREIINRFYGDRIPVTSYIPQSPCAGNHLAIEALGVARGKNDVRIEHLGENVVVTSHNDVSWIHCGQISPQSPSASVYDCSKSAFGQMQDRLTGAGAKFDQIVRTWLYLGDIVGPEKETQRYKELNRARTDFFKPFHFGNNHASVAPGTVVYPASTGIGTDGRGILMSCVALATKRDDVFLTPLENPRQVAAFDYAAVYSPESPKFARAMAVRIGNIDTVFVSGTASITDSESRYIGDVKGQTNQTLDNIAALISPDNFKRHSLKGGGQTLDDLAIARVYIKRREDYDQVKAVCEARLGELPTIYAVADVCRPELLVEIEGMAFSDAR